MNDWLQILENHAVLPIICVAILIGLYRLSRTLVVDVFKPAVTTLVSKSIDTLARAQETLTHAQRAMTKIEETQVVIVGAIARLETQAQEHRSIVAKQTDRLAVIDERLLEIDEHVRRPQAPQAASSG